MPIEITTYKWNENAKTLSINICPKSAKKILGREEILVFTHLKSTMETTTSFWYLYC